MSRRIIHRIPDLYSGGAEVVVANIVRAFPEIHHTVAFTAFYETWLSRWLAEQRNVVLLQTTTEAFAAHSASLGADLILFHIYPPMTAADIEILPAGIRSRVMIYNHHSGAPLADIEGVENYCFVSESSYAHSGASVRHRKCRVVINPVLDSFFAVSRTRPDTFTIGRHSRAQDYKFPSDFVELMESVDLSVLRVDILGATPRVRRELAACHRRHTYIIREFNSLPVETFLGGLSAYAYGTSLEYGETGPLCILEAMAAGLPVVAERRGAIPNFIQHGNTGFLYSSPQEFRSSIRLLHEDEVLAEAVARNARAWASDNCSLRAFRTNFSRAWPIL